ncbi:sensor histidine kinase [Paenibacillus crassostreae]|uniref:histidine kinase n=1 Tax=Paenibacillus crassostreae TaxID=1763538 RepID=A0A167EUS8_9BACL|nr:sensor histidine kinase [Paenibacillus crassostreae]AOZ93446.1 two-component sensor histidine kinase [Paenibacillus crassostreae]OAB75899.1 histidine kinase [Paenibacillus crassostreae]
MWSFFLLKTNNIQIKNKLIYSYIIVVMVPVIIIGVMVIGYSKQLALDSAIAQMSNNVDRVRNQMENMLRVPIDISNKLYLDGDLQSIVNRSYENDIELFQAYQGYKEFAELTGLYTEISGIRFYHHNETMSDNLDFTHIDDNITETEWYKTVGTSNGIGWFYMKDKDSTSEEKLSLVRRIRFSEYPTQGVLVISLNQNRLNSILSNEPFETMIADDSGYIVAAKNPDLVGKTLAERDLNFSISEASKDTFEAEVNGIPSNIVVSELTLESSRNGLNIVSVFSTESITKASQRIGWIGLVLIAAVLALALGLVYIISQLITSRLLHLSRQLNKVARGDFSVTSEIDGNDEIAQLSRQFNYMVMSINDLMNQVYETNEINNKLEIAQKEIRLKMMASQINPHFLFNVLESVRMKAHINGEKEIAYIVRLLGKLMRKSLEIGEGRTTVKEEMEMVRSYLEIQKFRYQDRMNFELLMDPDAKDVFILPLIIQPLVENGIIHGLESKEVNALLTVRCWIANNELNIEVKDNGQGISPENLRKIQDSLEWDEVEGARIGLRNIHQRLKLFYGDEHGLVIVSELGIGTTILFNVPIGGDSFV